MSKNKKKITKKIQPVIHKVDVKVPKHYKGTVSQKRLRKEKAAIFGPDPLKEFKGKTPNTKLISKGKILTQNIEPLAKIMNLPKEEVEMFAMSMLETGTTQLNYRSVVSFFSSGKISRFLINMGVDEYAIAREVMMSYPTDFASEQDVIREIEDPNRWAVANAYKVDGPLTLSNGVIIEFDWDYYEGAVYWIVD